jgi:hypothetical protein
MTVIAASFFAGDDRVSLSFDPANIDVQVFATVISWDFFD